ncbi:MAG: aminopeptidase P N-terminal domain-containing protein [Ignavibacteriales bacterium]|nr:aminopeptidase P N-terminal domain-containing protein [Ignavibacteriales bacterium]
MWNRNPVNPFLVILNFLIIIPFINYYPQLSDKTTFKNRRESLLSKMDGGIAIIKGAKVANRNGDVDFQFRQNSDFYYLTGFEEPGSALLLIPGENKKFVMFVRQKNLMMEAWMGARSGIEGAIKNFDADTAFGIGLFEKTLTSYLKGKNKIYLNTSDKDFVKLIDSLYKKANGNLNKENLNVNKIIAEMRVIKSPEEISLIKTACDITAEAQIEAMKAAKPNIMEIELAAIIEYIFKKDGAQYTAFPSIVGSGINSTILHYEAGNRKLEKNDVVVMDLGSEYNNYASDITRTIPANGKFSTEQKDIYEIVLHALNETIDYAKPGIGFNEIQNHAKNIITDGLFNLGLIFDKTKSWQTDIWMPHGISHYVGLDVHDVGDVNYSDPIGRLVEPGMVFTIEPGIYVSENVLINLKEFYGYKVNKNELEEFIIKVKPNVEKYKNIGIRIEDTVVITNNSCQVLSSKAPKEIDEIENLMLEKSSFIAK